MLDALKALAEQAVGMAKEAGATDAWSSVSRSRSVDLSYRDGKLEKTQEATSRGLELRVYADGRYSTHSTSDLRPERLRAFVADAVGLTRALQPDPFRFIPDPALFAGRSTADLQTVDAALAALTAEDRLSICKDLDAATRASDRVISATSWVSDGHAASAAASSNGFSGTHEQTWLWYGSDVSVRDEGDKRPEEGDYVGGHHREGLPSASEVGRRSLEMALKRLGSAKGPTLRGAMVVDARASARLISSALSPATARAIQQGRSFWRDKVGQQLFGDKLTVIDEPLLPRGLGSRPYDDEGIALKAMPIVEAGVAKNLYVDTYYGKKAGLTPTTGSPSNRVVTPGADSLDALLARAGKGIYVTSWLGGNADSTTGDFSFGLRGFHIEGGKVGAPVGEMNVTGNLSTLLKQLVALGNDPFRYSATVCPSLLFEGVQFSGV